MSQNSFFWFDVNWLHDDLDTLIGSEATKYREQQDGDSQDGDVSSQDGSTSSDDASHSSDDSSTPSYYQRDQEATLEEKLNAIIVEAVRISYHPGGAYSPFCTDPRPIEYCRAATAKFIGTCVISGGHSS